MKRLRTAAGVALLIAASTTAFSFAATQRHTAAADVVSAVASPRSVMVELFTSEGCSDCPPADAELAKLSVNQAITNVNIIPLEEHVDYFNSRSWSDPFSEHALALRQGDYMRAFRNNQVYTPQMVVQGRSEFVGSDDRRAQSEIDLSAHDPHFVPFTLSVRVLPGKKLEISVKAPATTRTVAEGSVFYAITQDGLSSDVSGGENAGHKLIHAAVVRHMDRLTAYDSDTGVAHVSKIVPLRPETRLQNLHVVAFIQCDNAGAILSAAKVDLKDIKDPDSDAVSMRH